MKKISIFLVMALFLICSGVVNADVISDVHNGNGERVIVTAETITYEAYFSPQDPSTDGGRIKTSVPYNGSPKDEGFWLCKGGETFVGKLGFSSKESSGSIYSEPFVVPTGGKGPVVLVFRNLSLGEPIEMVISVSRDGLEKEWLCIPWEGTKLRFAIVNPDHPKNTQHTTAFRVEGDRIFDIVEDARKLGWVVVAEYWRGQGEKLTRGELLSGRRELKK